MKPSGDVHHISDNSKNYIDFVAAFPRITETNIGESDCTGKAIVYGEAVPVASPCRPLHGDKKKAIEAELLKW